MSLTGSSRGEFHSLAHAGVEEVCSTWWWNQGPHFFAGSQEGLPLAPTGLSPGPAHGSASQNQRWHIESSHLESDFFSCVSIFLPCHLSLLLLAREISLLLRARVIALVLLRCTTLLAHGLVHHPGSSSDSIVEGFLWRLYYVGMMGR